MTSEADWPSLMRAENFSRAWQLVDQHLAVGALTCTPKHVGPRHRQRIWRGEKLRDRRVLVRCYHGLGDTIQFCRFLAPLRRVAREVIVWCQPDLIPLIRTAAGVDTIMPLHDGTPEVAYDVDIEIMELAHALRAGRNEIAGCVPYLHAPPASAGALPGRRCRELAVGLVWQVGDWAPERSIAPEALRPLSGIANVLLYSLQRGPAQRDARLIPAEDVSCASITGMAARLHQLDLLISVDSMPVHLAGALGLEVWTLLPAPCDWRWPCDRPTSLWYPTMRLFHQRQAGRWDDVIGCASDALVARANEKLSRVPDPA